MCLFVFSTTLSVQGEMLSKLLVALGKNDAPALSRTLVDLFSNLTSKGKGAGDVSLLGLRIKVLCHTHAQNAALTFLV